MGCALKEPTGCKCLKNVWQQIKLNILEEICQCQLYVYNMTRVAYDGQRFQMTKNN